MTEMKFSAQQIADFLGAAIEGNPEVSVNGISGIDQGKPGTLTFLSNPAYVKHIYSTKASIVLVSHDFKPEKPLELTLIRTDDPYHAFAKLLQMVESTMKAEKKGVAKTAVIAPSVQFDDPLNVWIGEYVVIGENVRIGKNVEIYPHTFIGDGCVIGERTILYAGVKLYHSIKVGAFCIIHSGVVLGSDGFGFAPGSDGVYAKIPQLGNVVVEDNVEIGANTVIDRGSIGSTIIREGTKMDNLIHMAHNCEVGKHSAIAAQTGFSGSTSVGANCMIGGQVGLSGHISIGDKVMIAAQSGIAGNVKSGSVIMGSPAFDAAKYKRAYILFKNIEDLHKRILKLENPSTE
jgi:UDP-3-O-[3-hydroxymyristoyl] glucosamine N-acyltransferase